MKITDISGTILKNSRSEETIAVTVTAGEAAGTFAVPSGASTGGREIGAKPAVEALAELKTAVRPVLVGLAADDQEAIDSRLRELGAADAAGIGGNTMIGASIAACKAAAAANNVATWQYVAELFSTPPQAKTPRLFVNLINGGKHAKNGSVFQEHQIIPDTDDFPAALEAVRSVQRVLRQVLEKAYGGTALSIGDEGGFVTEGAQAFEPFRYLTEALESASLRVPAFLGADMAANSFFDAGVYRVDGKGLDGDGLLALYGELHESVPLLHAVEDPFEENDLRHFSAYHRQHSDVLTTGDDLTTTDVRSLETAAAADAISAIIIKPNQVGTLSDTFATMRAAYSADIRCIVSHRSGETMDDFIADLTYGTKCYGMKAGAPDQKERAVKYERLLTLCTA